VDQHNHLFATIVGLVLFHCGTLHAHPKCQLLCYIKQHSWTQNCTI